MIATPRFVFLHLHKSGGTFINAGLMHHVAGARQLGYHLPRPMIPESLRALPVLGLVRNPWSYYVSWYAFQQSRPQPNALFRVLSDEGALDFSATLRRMLSLGRDDALLDRVIAALPSAYTNQGLNLPGFALASIRGGGLGFYSWLHAYMHRPDLGVAHIGRMEHLRSEFAQLLERVQQPVVPELREFIATAPAMNASRHAPYAQYYDAALAAVVARADRSLIDEFGYAFGV